MKRILMLALLVLIPAGRLWALDEAIFTSVTGKVEIRGHKGHMLRIAQKDTTVVEGERIVAGSGAQATLQTFDGSELKISPNTDFWLDKLKKPDAKDKVIQFKLMLGQLFAKVTKLVSAKSSFEINAGGVVCGVRGTEYQVKYDPSTNTVYLGVLQGTVYTTSNGQTNDYGAGSSAVFHNGSPIGGSNTGLPGNNGNNGGQGNNDQGNNPDIDDGALASLQDLNNQFQGNITSNGNTSYTDPSVEGSIRVNVTANIPSRENVP